MNKQEIFDKVVSHLRAQKKQALGSNHLCAYRGVDGTKCAAGCLITDEVYARHNNKDNTWPNSLEGRGVNYPLVSEALEASGVPTGARTLVMTLQSVHDNEKPEYWEQNFFAIAKSFGLTLSPSTEASNG